MPKLQELSIVSNGFATERIINHVIKIANLCKQKGVKLAISISIDGVGKIHDSIRKIPNGFLSASTTLLRLKNMEKSHHINVSSGSLVLRQNLARVDEMRRWFEEHNIQYGFQIVGFHDTYVRNLDTQKTVDFNDDEKSRLEQFLLQESKLKSLKDTRAYYWRDLLAMYRDRQRRTTPCPFLKDYFALDSFGSVYYCFSSASIGNFRKTYNVSDIYFNNANLNRRKKMWNSVCVHCNSGCRVDRATLLDVKSYAWFRLTGKPWYGFRSLLPHPSN